MQEILKKITGLYYEKVFARRQMKPEPEKFEFVTQEKLKKVYLLHFNFLNMILHFLLLSLFMMHALCFMMYMVLQSPIATTI